MEGKGKGKREKNGYNYIYLMKREEKDILNDPKRKNWPL